MASEVGKRMNDLVTRLAFEFRSLGFTRAGRHFHRPQPDCVQRVYIQGSSANGFGGIVGAPQFFVEVSVYFGEYRQAIGEAPLDRPTSTSDVSRRLSPPGRYPLWTADIDNLDGTVRAVMDVVDREGEQFFERFLDLGGVERSVDEAGGPPAYEVLGLVSFERAGRAHEWWSRFEMWASGDFAPHEAKRRDRLLDRLSEAGRPAPG